MHELGALSGAQGSVLDPIEAIRGQFVLDPDESITVDLVSGAAGTRASCLGLVGKYQDRRLANRVFALASTHAQVVLRQLNASEADAQLYCRLAASIIYANPSLRADPATIAKNRQGQSGLWGFSVSGDLPIVLLQIADAAHIELVRQMVQAHAYWRLKGLAVDLVIWNEDRAGYRQLLHEQINALVAAGVEPGGPDRPGTIFVRPAEQISTEDRILFQSVATAIIADSRGSLAEQIAGRPAAVFPPRFAPARIGPPDVVLPPPPHRDLVFFNGLGGFTPDGREYVITTGPGAVTPAPWVNVLANPRFGTVVSESGSAYSWAENAHEFRLTPWNNDPVADTSGEVFYLRDEESGHFWSPTPLPAGEAGQYTSRHGFGYSVFEHGEDGVVSQLWVYVDTSSPVKWSVLKVCNQSGRTRRLSATGYVEWVLGDLRGKTAPHVVTAIDPETGALFAQNAYNAEFAGRIAFFHVDDGNRRVSGDRTEFIGRNGTPTAGRDAAHHALGPRGCRARSVRSDPGALRSARRRRKGNRLYPRRRTKRRGCGAGAAMLPGTGGRPVRARGRVAAVEPHARSRQRADTRPGARHPDQRLAALPDHGVPPLGAQRLVPVRRRVRIPRPVTGHHGAGARAGTARPTAPAALRVPAVPRRRRAALVASAGRPRRSHPLLGRLPVAAAGDVSVRHGYRRHRRARRTRAFHRGPPGQSRRGFVLRPAWQVRSERQSLRPLRSRHCPRPAARHPWPAAHRLGRLERRHEPRRRSGAR
jgi:hypothetical protein